MVDLNLHKKVNSTLKDKGIIDLSMAEFEWRIPGLMKGIDPNAAFKEVERIKEKHGNLTPWLLLIESRPKDAVFHKYFNWDDRDAAEKYRLDQARELINNIRVNIITDGEARSVSVYEVVKKPGGARSYTNIETLTSEDVEYVRLQVIKALKTYRNKLVTYDLFKVSVECLDNAISELEAVSTQVAA